jgi:sigma-E factor negative regulatory protein RseB
VSEVTLGAPGEPGVIRSDASWMPAWVPSGFMRITSVVHPIEKGPTTATRMLFSDGLADFSLFVEPEPREPAVRKPALIESRSGATVTISRVGAPAVADVTPVRFTLVGEIPLVTARRILESLEPVSDRRADARTAP